MYKIVTLPVFNVVSGSPGELFTTAHAHGDLGLAKALMTLSEKPYLTYLTY